MRIHREHTDVQSGRHFLGDLAVGQVEGTEGALVWPWSSIVSRGPRSSQFLEQYCRKSKGNCWQFPRQGAPKGCTRTPLYSSGDERVSRVDCFF